MVRTGVECVTKYLHNVFQLYNRCTLPAGQAEVDADVLRASLLALGFIVTQAQTSGETL